MAYFAKLENGETYEVSGVKFTKGKEYEVAQDLYEYLQDNAQFVVREGEAAAKDSKQGQEGDDLTDAELEEAKELEKKSRDDLDELAIELELDPKAYKTKLDVAKAIIVAERNV